MHITKWSIDAPALGAVFSLLHISSLQCVAQLLAGSLDYIGIEATLVEDGARRGAEAVRGHLVVFKSHASQRGIMAFSDSIRSGDRVDVRTRSPWSESGQMSLSIV